MEHSLISYKQQPDWFTIIELLVVIFVIGVGILSIVLLIANNLSLSGKAHNQNTATILAREGMELLYNYRDSNLLLWYERNCAERLEEAAIELDKSCKTYFWTGGDQEDYYFRIDGASDNLMRVTMQNLQEQSLAQESKLYLTHIGNWYTGYSHEASSDQDRSWFSRYIVFKTMKHLVAPLDTQDIHRVEVHVWYNYAGKTWDVVLSSFIANPH
mgnify:CR=1 FL=1